MRTVNKPAVKIAGAAVLAPMSVIMQIIPPIFFTPWFMRIDLVAVPWVLCWVIFGFKAALLSLLISAPLVGVLGPLAGGWVGAIMKSVASVWMFAIPAVFAYRAGGVRQLLERREMLLAAAVSAVVMRGIVTLLFNFYFALPVFFGWDTATIISFFTNPASQSFVGKTLGMIGLGAFVVEVVFWNTVQGVIDISVSSVVGSATLRRLSKGP